MKKGVFLFMNKYADLLDRKEIIFHGHGFEVSASDIHPALFDFQNALVRYALKKGDSLIAADTGLGKTPIATEYARLTNIETGKPALIVAYLSVAHQFVEEMQDLLNIEINYIKSSNESLAPINITNYANIRKFNFDLFGSVISDEVSIVKSIGGKIRKMLTESCKNVPFVMGDSATPNPNGMNELANIAELLKIMKIADVKATFFVNRENKKTGEKWQLRALAKEKFYRWLASWCMSVRVPSDIGFPDDGYILPALHEHLIYTDVNYVPSGMLFNTGIKGLAGRNTVRKITADARVKKTIELVQDIDNSKQVIVWSYYNPEAIALTKAIPDAVEIAGRHSTDYKIDMIRRFKRGDYRVVVSKDRILAWGMNLQNCNQQVSCGLSDSYESYYQRLKRSHRFGQLNEVDSYTVIDKSQRVIYNNVKRKESMVNTMKQELIKQVQAFELEELGKLDTFAGMIYNPTTHFQLPTFMR